MKRKTKSLFLLTICLCFAAWLFPVPQIYASDGEYITISVDATDDNGNLKYALDTDDPAAFTDSNEFTILEGTSHTIYVKDIAGNITSQTYSPSSASYSASDMSDSFSAQQENEQRINIDLEIGRQSADEQSDYSGYEYLTDGPVEPGTGTVAEKVRTDGSEDSDRIFYTITTKEGEVLYLIVDQGQSADNVYLLDTVSADDLLALADGGTDKTDEPEKEDNLLVALSKENDTAEEENKESGSSNSNLLIVLFFVIIGGGAYYYFKIYKNKKDEAMDVMDALDMEDFEPEEDEDEADFSYDDTEKEQYLSELINEDDEESLYDANPEEYADLEDIESEEPNGEPEPGNDIEEYGFDEKEEEDDI